jgi:hypothetical protein
MERMHHQDLTSKIELLVKQRKPSMGILPQQRLSLM